MITLTGDRLTVEDIVAVSKGAPVRVSDEARVRERVRASAARIEAALQRAEPVYGVTTLYGGMADRAVPFDQASELQRVALVTHRTATGPRLDRAEVRAAMLLRANSLLKGYSAIRLEIIERYATCLNAGFTPHAYRLGSIGASGDLIPLSYIGSAVLGLDPAFKVELDGQDLDCIEALDRIGLTPMMPRPKEGLSLNNGTGACTAVAALATQRLRNVLVAGFGAQALMFQALKATDQSFHPAIQAVKPHAGQILAGEVFRRLLAGSALIRDESGGARGHRGASLIQDRYALRCHPQFTGPILDAFATAARQLEVEANSANDNPLVDPETGEVYHTGNFLAQYTALAADSLRLHLALFVKHLDVQIAMLVAPEFSGGLPPSLVGNTALGLNIGLKSLQIHANALAPLVQYHARPMADLFPTHAEQFNQNINSQGMNSANLLREQVELAEQFVAVATVFALQAVELRAQAEAGRFDAGPLLSPATRPFYTAARELAGGAPGAPTSLIWDDAEARVQDRLEALLADLRGPGRMVGALAEVGRALDAHRRGEGPVRAPRSEGALSGVPAGS